MTKRKLRPWTPAHESPHRHGDHVSNIGEPAGELLSRRGLVRWDLDKAERTFVG